MGNKIFEKACQYLLDLMKKDIFPFIDANLKSQEARKLKSDIYFGLQQFKKDAKDVEITQILDSDSVQGKLKQQTGALRIFMDLRAHFYIKKIQMDGNDYIEGYLSVQTKGLACKWVIASDARVRVRVSI